MKKPTFENYHDYMKWRLDRRCQTIRDRADKIMRVHVLKRTDKDQNSAEEDRLWLDTFANGNGLDICCGDFLVGGEDQASGVDGYSGVVGVDYVQEGDDLCFVNGEELDFIVSNYLDGLPNPLSALQEWGSKLKKGGALAVTVRDADSFSEKDTLGGLKNPRKQSAYSQSTLRHYLGRCGFSDIKIERTKAGMLRASAVKNT